MKTAVICTNRYAESGAAVIFRGSMETGVLRIGERLNPDFVVDFDALAISGWWGSRETMTKNEALRFGADFGLWFES